MSKIFLLNYSNKADILDQLDDGALRRFFTGPPPAEKRYSKFIEVEWLLSDSNTRYLAENQTS